MMVVMHQVSSLIDSSCVIEGSRMIEISCVMGGDCAMDSGLMVGGSVLPGSVLRSLGCGSSRLALAECVRLNNWPVAWLLLNKLVDLDVLLMVGIAR